MIFYSEYKIVVWIVDKWLEIVSDIRTLPDSLPYLLYESSVSVCIYYYIHILFIFFISDKRVRVLFKSVSVQFSQCTIDMYTEGYSHPYNLCI